MYSKIGLINFSPPSVTLLDIDFLGWTQGTHENIIGLIYILFLGVKNEIKTTEKKTKEKKNERKRKIYLK